MTLEGRLALVTGGSRGIGRAAALVLAEAGADVAITYRERADAAEEVVAAIRALGRRALSLRAELGPGADATPGDRRGHRRPRAGRRAGEQRRRARAEAVRGDHGSGPRSRAGRQSEGRVPALTGGHGPDARARLGPDRQRGVLRRAARRPAGRALLCEQGRGDRPHALPGAGRRAARRRQLRVARPDRDRDDRARDRIARSSSAPPSRPSSTRSSRTSSRPRSEPSADSPTSPRSSSGTSSSATS